LLIEAIDPAASLENQGLDCFARISSKAVNPFKNNYLEQ
jgi:hypothetical protein